MYKTSSRRSFLQRLEHLENLSNGMEAGFFLGEYDYQQKKYKLTNSAGKSKLYTKAQLIKWLQKHAENEENCVVWFGLMDFEEFEAGHPVTIRTHGVNGKTLIDKTAVKVIEW